MMSNLCIVAVAVPYRSHMVSVVKFHRRHMVRVVMLIAHLLGRVVGNWHIVAIVMITTRMPHVVLTILHGLNVVRYIYWAHHMYRLHIHYLYDWLIHHVVHRFISGFVAHRVVLIAHGVVIRRPHYTRTVMPCGLMGIAHVMCPVGVTIIVAMLVVVIAGIVAMRIVVVTRRIVILVAHMSV